MLATIGYERSTLSDFIATLKLGNIETLVDVRERAQSRRPGFSKKSLEATLREAGIEYLHLPQLGDPKEGRDAARAGDMARFREIYHEAISTSVAREALSDLEKLASEKAICLMCFERDPGDCHRKIVADKLEKSLQIKASHWGVRVGAAHAGRDRRVLHSNQSSTASVQ